MSDLERMEEERRCMLEELEMLRRENHMLRLQRQIADLDEELRHGGPAMQAPPASDGEEEQLRLDALYDECSSDKKPVTSTPAPSTKPYGQAGFELPRGIKSEDETRRKMLSDEYVTYRKRPEKSDLGERPLLGKEQQVKVKPATYDGSGSWTDYHAHFEACSKLNGWNACQKGLYLSVSLRGRAQGVFGNLDENSTDYCALVEALQDRFAPPNQTELYRVQLRDRRQKATEPLAELGQDIRRLTNLAYPSAPSDVRETLAKEQFVDALINSDMRLKIKQSRPTCLNDAVRLAVELEAFYRAEREQHGVNTAGSEASKSKDIEELQKSMAKMQAMLESLTQDRDRERPVMKRPYFKGNTNDHRSSGKPGKQPSPSSAQGPNRPPRKCFCCGSEKHLISACPKAKKQEEAAQKTTKSGQSKGKFSRISSAGIYTTATIDGQFVDCLVDTGASLTLISREVWQSVKGNHILQPFETPIVSASGDQMSIEGQTEICLQFGETSCPMKVVVASLDVDVVLGIDFMQNHQVSVDVNKLVMLVQGVEVKIQRYGKIGCYRVVLAEKVDVPPRSEVITKGQISDQARNRLDYGLIESSERFLECGKGIVARTLVKADGEIPIRLANFSQDMQTFYPGTNIATLSSVSSVEKVKERSAYNPVMPDHLKQLYHDTTDGMHDQEKRQVRRLLLKYAQIFSKSDEDLGRTGIIKHQIPTGEARPIKQPLRRVPVHMQDEVDEQLDKMLKDEVIQPSTSPWSSGIVLVKKRDGTQRFCIDYRRLNDATIKDAYPLPRIDESLDQLTGAKWFSCLDLSSGYWQVEVEDSDKAKTAFATRRGLFEFNVMPFGLCNAPATFERLMESVLAGLHWQICLVYLDDIIVVGRTFEEMIANLDTVFQRFENAGLKLKPRKCQLFKKEVEFLGHVVSEKGVATDPKKIESVVNWSTPKSVTEVRSFLGLCSYYRKFIKDYSQLAKPLFRLTEKHRKFEWTPECETTFILLKQHLSTSPILAHPDFSKPFILDTDASEFAIGSVLSQQIDGKERVIAYASRTLTKAEKRYCVTRKEMLALVFFVRHFKHYLYGRQFKIRTDHSSLRWLMKFKEPEGQVARWLEVLAPFQMEIEHRKGRLHGNADGLSRKPCRQCGLTDEEKLGQAVSAANQIPSQSLANPNQVSEETKQLRELQAEDSDVKTVHGWVAIASKPSFKDIQETSYYVKSLWNQFEKLEIKDGLLVRKWDNVDSEEVSYQVIVPSKQRRNILKHAHDIKAAGHLGIRKTLAKVRQNFYWPGLKNDVVIYVSGCHVCMKRKGPNKTKQAPMQIVRSGYPMERLAIDILGELPETDNGNRYILVIADYFTKWTECFAMRNMEAATVARILVEEVVTRFGVPTTIHSDQGRQFESKLFREMCSLLGTEKTRTTPYHPQSDGMVERFNRTLTAMLSAYVNENHTNWDENIPFVMMAYRSSEHETTGMSPNMLMLGRNVSTPLDLLYELPRGVKEIPQSDWVWKLQERLENAHTFVRETTGRSMLRQKSVHDRRTSYETFKTNDKVFVFFPVKKAGTSAKLTSFWRGPFRILAKISDVTYKVNCGQNQTPKTIHCDRIRKCKSQTLRGEESTETPETNDHLDTGSYDDQGTEALSDPGTEEVVQTGVRKRKPPVWSKDYVFTFSESMAKTKTTPRKPPTVCPGCREVVGEQKYDEHVKACKAYITGRKPCKYCPKTFKRPVYLRRHMEAAHGQSVEMIEAATGFDCPSSDTDLESDDTSVRSDESWDQDPEIDIESGEKDSEIEAKAVDTSSATTNQDEPKNESSADSNEAKDESLLTGRLFRKPTRPMHPKAPKRKATETAGSSDSTPSKMASLDKNVQADLERSASLVQEDKATQADLRGEFPFQCPHCKIGYKSAIMFYIHQGCHTKGQPFRCNVCEKECDGPLDFYTHINREHDNGN